MIWAVGKGLTELVLFVMSSYDKIVVDTTDTPILFLGCGRLSYLVSSKAIILYVNKCIYLSIYSPWHLERIWHLLYKVYHAYKVKRYFCGHIALPKWSLVRLFSITITLLLLYEYYQVTSININYHQHHQLSLVGGWGQLAWCYTHYAVRSHISIYRRVRRYSYYSIYISSITIMRYALYIYLYYSYYYYYLYSYYYYHYTLFPRKFWVFCMAIYSRILWAFCVGKNTAE